MGWLYKQALRRSGVEVILLSLSLCVCVCVCGRGRERERERKKKRRKELTRERKLTEASSINKHKCKEPGLHQLKTPYRQTDTQAGQHKHRATEQEKRAVMHGKRQ